MKHSFWYLLFLVTIPAHAQISIDKKHHLMRNGDIICKQQVEYKSPGHSGENILWDFSSLKPIDENYELSYQSSNDSNFIGKEHRTIYRYLLKNDSLLILGYENPLTIMQHDNPELLLTFPFTYKSKRDKMFSGNGRYSEKMQMNVSGQTQINADAFGILILPNKDTLNHVLRIHSFRTAIIQLKNIQHTATFKTIAANMRPEIQKDSSQIQTEDIFRWYAEGYRYPVFETITHTYQKNGKSTSVFNTSFFYPPEEQKYLNEDIENLTIREQRKLEKDKNNRSKQKKSGSTPGSDKDIIHYEIQNNPDYPIEIAYFLSDNATISMILTDVQGRLIACIPKKMLSSGEYKESIDCSGLQRGEYILCLTVNEKSYSNKILVEKN